jgi:hypothetical protein
MAIQTSTSTEQILAKVLAIIPKILTLMPVQISKIKSLQTAFFNARSLRTT